MSYQERHSIMNIVSTIVISVIYAANMVPRYPQADPYSPEVYQFWGAFFLILIPVTIVAKIIITIIFSIFNSAVTRENEPPLSDERDQLIDSKATLRGLYTFVLGFILAMGSIVIGVPPAGMFIILFLCGIVTDLIIEMLRFNYYRLGV